LITDDIRRFECGQIAVVRVLYFHRFAVNHQLQVRYDRAKSLSDLYPGQRDANQRHRKQGGERSVPKIDADHQPANNRMHHPGNAERRHNVCCAEHNYRAV